MYALSTGISHVGSTLPEPVYALISGVNGATVGIIALSAVRLAQRSITDRLTRLTRLLVAFGGIWWRYRHALHCSVALSCYHDSCRAGDIDMGLWASPKMVEIYTKSSPNT